MVEHETKPGASPSPAPAAAPPPRPAETPSPRRRPLGLTWGQAALLVALAGAFAFMSWVRVWHTDVWGHLRFGEYMVQNHRLPGREMFSGDYAEDAEYINYQWVTQAGGYLLYDLGRHFAPAIARATGQSAEDAELAGGAFMLSLGLAVIVTLRLLVLGAAFRRLTGSDGFALLGVVTVFVVGSLNHVQILRPQSLGELGFALVLLALSRPLLSRRALAWLPAVMVVWTNCHGSVLMGFVLMGAFLAGRALEVAWAGRGVRGDGESATAFALRALRSGLAACFRDPQFRRLGLLLAVSVAAALALNPHGPRLFLESWKLSKHPNIAFMEEWKAVPVKSLSGYIMLGSALVLAALVRWSPRRFTPTQVILLLGFGLQALAHARVIVWWVMVFTWVALPHLQAVWQRYLAPRQPRSDRPALVKLALGAVAAALVLALSAPAQWALGGKAPVAEARVTPVTPIKAVRYLRGQYAADPSLKRVVFTSETLGDFLLWELRTDPPVRVFCYTHVHLLTPEHWQKCMSIKRGDHRWRQVVDEEGIQFLVVERDLYEPLVEQVLADRAGWEVVSPGPVFVAKRRPSASRQP